MRRQDLKKEPHVHGSWAASGDMPEGANEQRGGFILGPGCLLPCRAHFQLSRSELSPAARQLTATWLAYAGSFSISSANATPGSLWISEYLNCRKSLSADLDHHIVTTHVLKPRLHKSSERSLQFS